MAPPRKFSDADIIAALRKARGMVYVAARELGTGPNTIYMRLRRSEKLRAELEAIRGEQLDMAELTLMKRVQMGDSWAIQFFLKTQGKERGYTERTEHRVIENVDVRDLTDEQLRRIAQGEDPQAVLADEE